MQNTYRDAFVDCCNLILQFYRSMRIDRGENHGLGAYAGVHHRNRRPRIVLRNEYLVTENRILEARIKGRLLFSDVEKKTFADIGYRFGQNALKDVAVVARPVPSWSRIASLSTAILTNVLQTLFISQTAQQPGARLSPLQRRKLG